MVINLHTLPINIFNGAVIMTTLHIKHIIILVLLQIFSSVVSSKKNQKFKNSKN